MITIPEYSMKVLNTLKASGYEAYAVGGCVRDAIIGRASQDVDITTSASSDEIENLFPGSIRTGGRFYTVTVFSDGIPVEVTPFRKESCYSDSRRPNNIEIASSLLEDIKRRDFTVNSICFDGEKTVDLLGGIKDIDSRLIRSIGDPDLRFGEDALRILRAFRFSAVLGFKIEEKTFESALRKAHLLQNISLERILDELIKILTSNSPEAISPLLETETLKFVSLHPSPLIKSIKYISHSPQARVSAFFEACGRDAASKLPLSNKQKRFIFSVFSILDSFPKPEKKAIKHILSRAEPEELNTAAQIAEYFYGKRGNYCELLSEIQTNGEPYKTSHLAINGYDILAAGIPQDMIKIKLDQLLNAVIENPELNKKDTLISLIS